MFQGSDFSKCAGRSQKRRAGVGASDGGQDARAGLEWLEERRLLVVPAFGALPNLAPWKPAGWSDKIVVNKQSGVYTDSDPIYSSDNLYVNWAEINNGGAPTSSTFYSDLYVDDVYEEYWYTGWPFDVGASVNPASYAIGRLSAGRHTIRIVIDSSDSVDETSELDNSYTKTITVVPVVTDVSSPADDDSYKAGSVIPITVTFSGTVVVSTLHGTPRLALNDQGLALYAGGSGTNTLTFNYTVAAGQNTADLDYNLATSLTLNGGLIQDAFGNNARLTLAIPGMDGSLGANKNIVIDTVLPPAPAVTGVSTDTGNSALDYLTNDQTLVINGTAEAFSTVTVSRADIGVIGTCTANASKAWSLDYTGTVLPEGSYGFTATATDLAGNTGPSSAIRTVYVDLTGGDALGVSSTKGNGSYKAWSVIPITVQFSESVAVALGGGVPTLSLNNGVILSYTSGSGSGTLVFSYTVNSGDNSPGLDYASPAALALNGGSIRDLAGNLVDLTLPAPGAAGSLSANKTLIIDTLAPNAPAFTGIDADTGFNSSDGITGDSTLVFNGAAEAGATVTVTRVGAGVIGDCTADGAGAWAFDYTGTVLPVGDYSFIATATDAAGNVGAPSSAYAVTISPAPTVTITPVSPDPRHAALDSIAIVFNEPVLGFGLEDLALTLNGGANLLTAPQAPTSADGIHWTVANLTALTGLAGDYLLTLTASGAGISDNAGNPLSDGASEAWHTNAAPALAGTNDLAGINEDEAANAGTSVSALISGYASDADAGALTGIAVTAADNTHGAWQFTTDGGATWAALGSPSASAARLLPGDGVARVRFVPAANWHGSVPGGITFRAWDRTDGASGSTANVSANGGLTAYSADTASAGVTVAAVNDKPAGVAQSTALDVAATVVITLGATDVETLDLSAFTFNVPGATAAGGTLTSLGNRQYQYAPAAGFVGRDYFNYTVTDDGDPTGSHGAPGDVTSDPVRVDIQVGSQFALPATGKGQYVDSNGDLVSLVATGAACTLFFPASGLVSLAAVHADAGRIELASTSASAKLTVTVAKAPAGDGRTTVGDVVVTGGSMASIAGALVDLTGDVQVDGSLGALTLGNLIGGGHAIEVRHGAPGVAGAQLTATFGAVADAGINTHGEPIASLTATRWTAGGSSTNAIVAPWIGKLTTLGVKGEAVPSGEFAADLTLDGNQQGGTAKVPAQMLATVSIGGDLSASAWLVSGLVGTMTVKGTTHDWSLGTSGSPVAGVNSLTLGVVEEANLYVTQKVGTLKAIAWSAGQVNAGTVGVLTVTGKAALAPKGLIPGAPAIAGDFLADMTLSGNGAVKGVAMGKATISGGLRGCAWDITGSLTALTVTGTVGGPGGGDMVQVKTTGAMGALTFGAANQADFLAGVAPAAAGDAAITRRADAFADFLTGSIKSVTIKPAKGAVGPCFTNSNFSAAAIGASTIVNPTYNNDAAGLSQTQDDFGFWTKSGPGTGIVSVKCIDTTAPKDTTKNWTWKPGQPAPAILDDLHVQPVA